MLCRLPVKFNWDPFSTAMEKLPVNDNHPTQVWGWVQTPQCFFRTGLTDFCAIFTIRYRIHPARTRQRCVFVKFPRFVRHVVFTVPKKIKSLSCQNDIMSPNLTPTNLRSLTPRFLFQPYCRLQLYMERFFRTVYPSRRIRHWNYFLFQKNKCWKRRFMCGFTIWYRLFIRPQASNVDFFQTFSHLAAMLDLNRAGPATKWHSPKPDPLQISELWSHVFHSSPSAVCVCVRLQSV